MKPKLDLVWRMDEPSSLNPFEKSVGAEGARTNWKLLLILLFLALSLRAYWLLSRTVVIENEGAEYARIAENLLKGNGYLGTMVDPQLTYGPLYPILIATVSLFSRDSEIAGRLVSVFAGTSLVFTIFFLAQYLYGRKTAFMAATLVAFHPLLIGFSALVYNEATYLAVMMAGIYWALRSLEFDNLTDSLLAGILFGLSYLSRVEAIVFVFLTVSALFAVAFINRKDLKKAALRSLVLLTAFVVLALPYIAFMSFHTGHIQWESKSKMNYTIGHRLNSGMNSNQAQFGIDDNLAELGPLLNPNSFANYSPYSSTPRDLFQYFLHAAKRNRVALVNVFSSFSLGAPILPGLILIGLFRKTWNRRRFIHEGFFFVSILFILFLLLSAHYIQFRYTLSFLPFLILWAAKGIEELSDWAMSTVTEMNLGFSSVVPRVGLAIQWVSIVAILALTGLGVFYFGVSDFELNRSDVLPVKEAGLWLRKYKTGPKRIMDVGAVVPYYADGFYVPFPYAGSSLTLKYIEHKAPDFIVFTAFTYHARPYLEEWFNEGIPDERATLIYDSGPDTTPGQRIKIYRWMGPHGT